MHTWKHCQFNVILCNSILYLKNHNYFVDGPDSLKIIPSLSAWENSPFNLTCSASCYKGCWSYSWYSDSKKEWLNQTTSILTFHNLCREDSGTYLCKVTDYFGQKSADYTLKVLCK